MAQRNPQFCALTALACLWALLAAAPAGARGGADAHQTLAEVGPTTTRLLLSARKCVFEANLRAMTKAPDPSAEPPATWKALLRANTEQFAIIKARPLPCQDKMVRAAGLCLPSIDGGVLGIPLGCTNRFAQLVGADEALTLGYDPPAKEGTPDSARQAIEAELEHLHVVGRVKLNGWYDPNDGHCSSQCGISVFLSETRSKSELAQVADRLFAVAKDAMTKAKLPALKVTNEFSAWSVSAARELPEGIGEDKSPGDASPNQSTTSASPYAMAGEGNPRPKGEGQALDGAIRPDKKWGLPGFVHAVEKAVGVKFGKNVTSEGSEYFFIGGHSFQAKTVEIRLQGKAAPEEVLSFVKSEFSTTAEEEGFVGIRVSNSWAMHADQFPVHLEKFKH